MKRTVWSCGLIVVLSCLSVHAEERVVMEDTFDKELQPGWTWLREDPQAWRLRDGALEIRVQPGLAETVKCALVRDVPAGQPGTKWAYEVTITNLSTPIQQYEQAGITWYHDEKPVFKLVKELVDGQLMIIPGRVPLESESVQLRLVVSGRDYEAQFRPDAEGEYQVVAKGQLPAGGKHQVSLQCYNGPPEAEHWIRFDNFRVLELP